MTAFTEAAQSLTGNAYVELFVLDCTNIGGAVYRFTPNVQTETGGSIVWQNNIYTPLPIVTEGWETKGDGSQSKPRLSVSNVNKTLLSAVVALGDLVGAYVTRHRTFAQFLDNGSSPDPTAHFPADLYVVEQKLTHDNQMIVWQMASVIDRFGLQLPRRVITKNGDSRYCAYPGIGLGKVSGY